jgi:hypothetical protein
MLSLFFGVLFASCNGQFNEDLQLQLKHESLCQKAYDFCVSNNYDTKHFFLLDFSIHSGKNRFFVYDFEDSIFVYQKLVTHGTCDGFEPNPKARENAKFSNKVDSHCSSKGKYKIGKRYYSSWGIHVKYWLHGLENTNDKAVQRVVVLHSWEAVANDEIYPFYSPLSWGCPAVSDDFMRQLDLLLQTKTNPVLLWIVE